MTKPLKKLRPMAGGPAGQQDPDKYKPSEDTPACKRHDLTLRYDIEVGLWVCPQPGCKFMAWPEADLEIGKPIQGRGPLQLVEQRGKFYIRATDNNMLIEVTDYMLVTDSLPTSFVTLQFTDRLKIDE